MGQLNAIEQRDKIIKKIRLLYQDKAVPLTVVCKMCKDIHECAEIVSRLACTTCLGEDLR